MVCPQLSFKRKVLATCCGIPLTYIPWSCCFLLDGCSYKKVLIDAKWRALQQVSGYAVVVCLVEVEYTCLRFLLHFSIKRVYLLFTFIIIIFLYFCKKKTENLYHRVISKSFEQAFVCFGFWFFLNFLFANIFTYICMYFFTYIYLYWNVTLLFSCWEKNKKDTKNEGMAKWTDFPAHVKAVYFLRINHEASIFDATTARLAWTIAHICLWT